MRFQLFKCEIKRADQLVSGYVVASDQQLASELIDEHEATLNQTNQGFTLERVDHTLPENQRKGLEALLEHAPAGLASYCEPIGWIAHTIPTPRLGFFRIEEADGDEYSVIAPNEDFAAAVYCEFIGLGPGDPPRLFRIHDGMTGLEKERLRGLPALLEFGPVGVVVWDDERGWSLV